MTYKISSKHKGKLAFEASLDGHFLLNDASASNGGDNLGPSPKKMMLQSLAACSGIDVVALLKKMRVNFSDFSIDVETQLTEEHPKVFKDITMVYHINVDENQQKKVEKAVQLSQEKYCGVSAMMRKNSPIHYSINFLK